MTPTQAAASCAHSRAMKITSRTAKAAFNSSTSRANLAAVSSTARAAAAAASSTPRRDESSARCVWHPRYFPPRKTAITFPHTPPVRLPISSHTRPRCAAFRLLGSTRMRSSSRTARTNITTARSAHQAIHRAHSPRPPLLLISRRPPLHDGFTQPTPSQRSAAPDRTPWMQACR